MDDYQKMKKTDLLKAYNELKQINVELVEALKRSNEDEKAQPIPGMPFNVTPEMKCDKLIKFIAVR